MPTILYVQGYVFNILNTIGIFLSLLRVVYIVTASSFSYTMPDVLLNLTPTLGCLLFMLLMHLRAYIAVVGSSFLLYPIVIMVVAVSSQDRGILLYLIAYMAYPFYFLHSKRKIIPVFLFVTIVFIFGLVLENDRAVPRDYGLEMVSLLGAVLLMFFSLFSIKYQIWGYQKKIRRHRIQLEEKNTEIDAQRKTLQEANQFKDKLLSIISHDLRTPIYGMVMLLETEKDMPREYFQQLIPDFKTELKRTAELFDNLLNWASLQLSNATGRCDQVDIRELTTKQLENLSGKAASKNLQLINQVEDSAILADESILEIVVRNLVANAIKFTQPGGCITVSSRFRDNIFELKVTDTGIGISPQALQRIRQQNFYTSKGTHGEKGTGLGLMICNSLVSNCKGRLEIESVPMKGTTMSILLPQ